MKRIVNGHGTIGKDGKYIVSPLDRKESSKLMKVLFAKVEKLLIEKFGSVVYYDERPKPYYWKLCEHAVGTLFTPPISINSKNFLTDGNAFISLEVGNCEAGYNDKEFKKHFNISFELSGQRRFKFEKRWDGATIIKKFVLADNLDEAIAEFEQWLKNDYDKFFTGRMLQNKTREECQ